MFQLLIITEMVFLCMRKTRGSFVFSSFDISFSLFSVNFFAVFTLYGIHVYIRIFVHTMEACNKAYYYLLLI